MGGGQEDGGTVGCSTVLGVVLELGAMVRARQWTKHDALQNTERILVNILALDERPRGIKGFQQTRRHEGYEQMLRQDRKPRRWFPKALRPMRLTLEQFEQESWWLILDLDEVKFPPAWCRRFCGELQQTVKDLIHAPLAPVP